MEARARAREVAKRLAEHLHAFPNDHPLQIAFRTYALALSLSLGPSLISVLSKARKRNLGTLGRVLRRDLGPTGFAFAITAGVAGGAALKSWWTGWERNLLSSDNRHCAELGKWFAKLKDWQKTFVSNALSAFVAIKLLQHRQALFLPRAPRQTLPLGMISKAITASSTLDLTLLFLVRALDALVRGAFLSTTNTSAATTGQEARAKAEKRSRTLMARLDAFVFWASSARIMWCFFYKPHRLPPSYNKWIMSMANIDVRILEALRAIREGRWSYLRKTASPPDILTSFARDLGYPSAWGDVACMPAYGGPSAVTRWKALGISNRDGLGGIPCELVHGGVGGGSSCTSNSMLRGSRAFLEALAIYLPVHFLPILLTRPRTLLNTSNLVTTLLSVFRSATFLSTFVSSIWFAICFTRTLVLARMLHWIPHDFWDGPYGCTFVGSLVCGGSIWIEAGRRRGEMALYVLPKAIRASLPDALVRLGPKTRALERLVFVLSLSTLLTTFTHRPENLRGLARWTLKFVMSGPNAGFWRRRKEDSEESANPSVGDPTVSLTH